jgi:hypothetical protein
MKPLDPNAENLAPGLIVDVILNHMLQKLLTNSSHYENSVYFKSIDSKDNA